MAEDDGPFANVCFRLGMGIVKNPQSLFDALVEAGVLEPLDWHHSQFRYTVIAPHVHEWYVWHQSTQNHTRLVDLRCDCGHLRTAPNRLPIEVPDG